MPDLGKYAFEVLLAYGATGLLLGALLWGSLARGARMKRRLAQAEAALEARKNG
ncbi:MAG: heme exporter protein D [Halocynthiibacter sp.]|jgi:heme exporter protein D